jgi:NADH-quinone oxidoreductase subunit C
LQCQFEQLIDIAASTTPSAKRFDVVYHLPRRNQRIRIKCETDADTPVPSVIDVFPAANWYERKAYVCTNSLLRPQPAPHLTDFGFQGFPCAGLPLTGYVEVRYDDDQKRVVYEPVKLTQEFRSFDFESPWEGVDYVLPGDEKSGSRQ